LWFIEHLYFLLTLVINWAFVVSIPPLRQAPNR
jgi:hypothetical protein